MSRAKKGLVGLASLAALATLFLSAVVGWAALTAEGLLQYPDWPSPPLVATDDPAIVAEGRYLVHGPAHCVMCHSTDDREGFAKIQSEPLHGGMAFEMGPIGTRYARNLTPDPKTGIGRRTDAELARAIRSGVMPEGDVSMFMAYSAGEMSDHDLVAVMSYLRSLDPVEREIPPGHYGLLAKLFVRFGLFSLKPRPVEGPAHVAPTAEPSLERGRYLADHVAFCKACHTSYDPSTFTPNGPPFGGGVVEASHGDDHGFEFAPPNLTSARTGFTGKVDEEAFVARIRAGRIYPSSIMPWEAFATMSDADIRSIYRYLRSVPPVDADTGPPYREVGSWEAPAP